LLKTALRVTVIAAAFAALVTVIELVADNLDNLSGLWDLVVINFDIGINQIKVWWFELSQEWDKLISSIKSRMPETIQSFMGWNNVQEQSLENQAKLQKQIDATNNELDKQKAIRQEMGKALDLSAVENSLFNMEDATAKTSENLKESTNHIKEIGKAQAATEAKAVTITSLSKEQKEALSGATEEVRRMQLAFDNFRCFSRRKNNEPIKVR